MNCSATASYGCKNQRAKIGVLLAQLGTPDAPTKQALRPYLKQFLSDRRVIEVNKYLWWFILNVIILNTRPKRSAALYQRIWTNEGSPLLVTTRAQARLCSEKLAGDNAPRIAVGMRYGSPSLESALDELCDAGCDRVLIFPLYPQYSASTTASSYDALFKHALKRRFVPTLKVVAPYYNRREFIDALVVRFREFWESKSQTQRPEKVILSYHGVPLSYVEKGDPYCCQCVETTQHFINRAGVDPSLVIHCYQSRFGNDPWLNPYTDKTVEALGHDGIKRLAVMCPGFTTDCLETIDEIGTEALHTFREAGGESLELIPCLNDHPAWIDAMASLIREEIAPWQSASILEPHCRQCPVDRS